MRLCRQNHCRALWMLLLLTLAPLCGWLFLQRAPDVMALSTTTLMVVGVVILNFLSTDSRG